MVGKTVVHKFEEPPGALEAGVSQGSVRAPGASGVLSYVLVLTVLAPVSLFLIGLCGAVLLVKGYPDDEDRAQTGRAQGFRMLMWLVFVNGFVGVIAVVPFAYTFRTNLRLVLRSSALLSLGWSAHSVLSRLYVGDADEVPVFQSLSSVILVPLYFLPLYFVRGLEKRGPATEERESWGRKTISVGVFLGAAGTLLVPWSPGLMLPIILLVMLMAIWALYKDPPATTKLSRFYVLALVFTSIATPNATSTVVTLLLDNLDQTDSFESLLSVAGLVSFLFLLHMLQYEFAKRGLPARHRVVALFPLQVFEDVYVELIVANARVFSGGYFVLLLLHVMRTLGRDGGIIEETFRVARNVGRRWLGDDPVPRKDDAVVELVRLWLQNMLSELSAMFVFVGVIAGEEAISDDVGGITGLNHGERLDLLVGYAVVFVVEIMTHVACYRWLLFQIARERGRTHVTSATSLAELQELDPAVEAGRLVQRHGLFLMASLCFVASITLFQVRAAEIEYMDR